MGNPPRSPTVGRLAADNGLADLGVMGVGDRLDRCALAVEFGNYPVCVTRVRREY